MEPCSPAVNIYIPAGSKDSVTIQDCSSNAAYSCSQLHKPRPVRESCAGSGYDSQCVPECKLEALGKSFTTTI